MRRRAGSLPNNSGFLLRVLQNINDYLYQRYGEYQTIEEEVHHMVKTLYDPRIKQEGIKEGIEKGIEKGNLVTSQKFICKYLRAHFGEASKELEEKVLKLTDIVLLEQISDKLFVIQSLDEVKVIVDGYCSGLSNKL